MAVFVFAAVVDVIVRLFMFEVNECSYPQCYSRENGDVVSVGRESILRLQLREE